MLWVMQRGGGEPYARVLLSYPSEGRSYPPDLPYFKAALHIVQSAGWGLLPATELPITDGVHGKATHNITDHIGLLVVLAAPQYGPWAQDLIAWHFPWADFDRAGDFGIRRLVFLIDDPLVAGPGRVSTDYFKSLRMSFEAELHANSIDHVRVESPKALKTAFGTAFYKAQRRIRPMSNTRVRPLSEQLVFLCHSSGDKNIVRRLRQHLTNDGIRCWFDEEDLLPGQDWDLEINAAIRRSSFALACLSRASITKAGYVQKELKRALDVADEQPEGAVFLIPVRLEECEVPTRLSNLHWVDLFRAEGYDRLLKALRSRRLGPS
jgi:TIR domain